MLYSLILQRFEALSSLLLAIVDLAGRDVHVLSTHVDSVTNRKNQLGIVIALFFTLDESAILIGDLVLLSFHIVMLRKLLVSPA